MRAAALFVFPLGILLGSSYLCKKGWSEAAIVRMGGAVFIVELAVFFLMVM